MLEFDYIIVGQGIAGSVLALRLEEKQQKVLLIDNNHKASSSMVAAGMWNPIIFKKLNKSWLCDELIPELHKFYTHYESVFNEHFLHTREICRPFETISEENDWLARSADANYSNYLDDKSEEDYSQVKLRKDKFYGIVKEGGYLDVPLFLRCVQKHFTEKKHYLNQAFNYQDLVIFGDAINYQNYSAKKIIFCEGHQIHANPWFKNLPVLPAKGEELDIIADGLPKKTIVNKGVWLLPISNAHYKVGSTFEWTFSDDLPSEDAKKTLSEGLNDLIKSEYTISKHEAGIRPTSYDRRPVVGLHTEHKSLAIFNGLGAKGIMQAPWLAAEFIQHLLVNKPLHRDICITRIKPKHIKKDA